MRLLLVIVILALALGLITFSFVNAESRVSLTLFNTAYPAVRLLHVVFLSVLVGVIATAIIAVAEGTGTRLNNRRLRRDIRRLETELAYLRTQPSTASNTADVGTEEPRSPAPPAEQPGVVPTAPVYGADVDSPDTDPEDDMYTGGRAV